MFAISMSAPTSITAQSWEHLQELLFLDSWNDDLKRFRSRYAYRGLSDTSYLLETTLMRLGGPYWDLEPHLLRNFKKYAHRSMTSGQSFWYWLSLAQHYGLPTRLLDWTYSPLIALHFATTNIEKYHLDGVIWAVNYTKVHNHLPSDLKKLLDEEGANVFTVETLSAVAENLKTLDERSTDPLLLFLEPPSLDERIINQFAFFSLMSGAKNRPDNWLAGHPEYAHRLIIPAALKWEIRDKLDQSNITERVLFTGLSGLSSWLKRHYSPKQNF